MDISVIIPVFNEEGNVPILHRRLLDVLKKTHFKYEIIFVDDGSTDDTFSVLRDIKKKHGGIKVVSFTRNFGKSEALSAGFEIARGKYIITMDGDLQDDPNEIPNFLNSIKNYDIVVGWKVNRKDPLTKRLPSKIFNRLTAWLTGLNIHDSNCCYKIYRKRAAKSIRIYGELHRYIPAIAHWEGFRVNEMKVKHNPRVYGKSKFGTGRLVKGFLDLITVKFLMSYNKRPMHIFGSIGLASFIIGVLVGIYLLYLRLFLLLPIGDRPLLMLSILLTVIGVQFISLGLLGEMIAYSHSEKQYRIKRTLI